MIISSVTNSWYIKLLIVNLQYSKTLEKVKNSKNEQLWLQIFEVVNTDDHFFYLGSTGWKVVPADEVEIYENKNHNWL